ncbi:MAG: PAS domain-containing protein [Candidatus Zixiibacteriota bacterium]
MTDSDHDKGTLGLSSEQLDRIAEATMDWIAVIDFEGRLRYFNPTIRDQIKDIKVGQKIGEIVVAKDRAVWEQSIAKSSDGQIAPLELGIHCDGSVRHFALRIVPFRSESELREILVVGFDITAERAAEDELRHRETLLQQAEQLGGLASWSWDIKSDVGYWSDNMYRIAGYAPQSFTPKYEMFMEMVHPVDRAELIATTEAIYRRDIEALTRPFEHEFRLLCPAGKIVHVLGRGEVKCNEDGEPIQTNGTLLDITERRYSEESLRDSERKLIEAQQLGKIGSWELNLETRILNWSEELYRIAGIEPNSVPATEEEFDRLFGATEESLLSQLLEVVQSTRTGNQIYELSREANLIRCDGSERFVFERGRVVFDANHRALRIQGIIQDVTEIKQMEIALRLANDRLMLDRELLENKNTTLREVLGQIKEERDAIGQQISQNVERLVRPALAKIRSNMGEHGRSQLDALETTIMEITSPFISEIERRFVNLTPREMEICHHIRAGLRSKEIADLLTISVQTVEKFRQKIRKKLGIEGTTANLSSYLRSIKPK